MGSQEGRSFGARLDEGLELLGRVAGAPCCYGAVEVRVETAGLCFTSVDELWEIRPLLAFCGFLKCLKGSWEVRKCAFFDYIIGLVSE